MRTEAEIDTMQDALHAVYMADFVSLGITNLAMIEGVLMALKWVEGDVLLPNKIRRLVEARQAKQQEGKT